MGILVYMIIDFSGLDRMDVRDNMCEVVCFDKMDWLMADRRANFRFIAARHVYYISTAIPEHNIAPPKFLFHLH